MAEPKCNWNTTGPGSKSFADREAGCPLDHCSCGTHDVKNERHQCTGEGESEIDFDVLAAEMAAGWDPNP